MKTVGRIIFFSIWWVQFNFSLFLMSSDWKCWPGVEVSQYWPLEFLSITLKPAELLRARQDGRGRWTVTRLSPDSWPVSKATKAQIAATTECRHLDWIWVEDIVQSVELFEGISAFSHNFLEKKHSSGWFFCMLNLVSNGLPKHIVMEISHLRIH